MKNFKKKAAAFMGAVTALCLTVGSLAMFTDRFQAQTTAKAGTLDITLTEAWTNDNAALAQAYKPGTALKLNYSVGNDGNMAADVRETFVLTFDKALSTTAREFDLYASNAVTVDAQGNVTKITGTPMTATTGNYETNGKTYYTLTYTPAQYTLNGDKTHVDGTVAGAEDVHSATYYVVFNSNAGNDFQSVGVTVDYMAQALQHANTGADTWTDAKVISQSVSFAGQNINVVPALN